MGTFLEQDTVIISSSCVGASRGGRGLSPDVPHLGAVLQVPAVGHLVLPAHVPGVLPQQAHLVVGVPRVPQGVPQVLAWPRRGLHRLGRERERERERDKETE